MLNLLTFHLQAICPENNIYRNYQISVGQDLFGSWLLTTLNGRIGTPGKLHHYAFEERELLEKKLHQILRKRKSAHKRMGTSYRLISCDHASALWINDFLGSFSLDK